MQANPRKGFAYWEVIVVLAIFLILALLLYPVFTKTRYDGPSPIGSCQSNEKQISLGIRQYIQDYNDKLPPCGPNRTAGLMGNAGGWADSLQYYLHSTQIFQCPAESNYPATKDRAQVDYGYNAGIATRSVAALAHSSNTVLLFEGNQQDATAQTASIHITSQVCTGRHLDGSNYGFVDGHVKWLQSTRFPATTPANGANCTFGS